MIRFDGPEVAKEFEESFGRALSTLTERELWWLVKFAKHVRGRCRSNSAFNNYMNRSFPHASFRQVTKERDDGEGTYEGLDISVKEKIDG